MVDIYHKIFSSHLYKRYVYFYFSLSGLRRKEWHITFLENALNISLWFYHSTVVWHVSPGHLTCFFTRFNVLNVMNTCCIALCSHVVNATPKTEHTNAPLRRLRPCQEVPVSVRLAKQLVLVSIALRLMVQEFFQEPSLVRRYTIYCVVHRWSAYILKGMPTMCFPFCVRAENVFLALDVLNFSISLR